MRAAAGVVDVIGREIELKAKGSLHLACCPFHEETSPSFQVDPGRGRWKCWGCDKHGDVFGWIMEREGVRFPDAVRILAQRFSVELPEEADEKPESRPQSGAVDVPGSWAVLRSTTAPRAVAAWLQGRGVHPAIADAAAQSDGVIHADGGDREAAVQILGYQPDDDGRPAQTTIEGDDGAGERPKAPRRRLPHHKVGIALRDEWGKVRDVERRATLSPQDIAERDIAKSLRLNRQDRGGFAVVFFGRVDRIRRAVLKGEPLIVVEGGPDWLVADGLCRLRGSGLAVGAAAGGMEALARLIRRMVKSMYKQPHRPPQVWLVPDIGDKSRAGERAMLQAAGVLAGAAVCRWCIPLADRRGPWFPRLVYRARRWRSEPGGGASGVKADLGDLAALEPDRVLEILERAQPVLDEGPRRDEDSEESTPDPWRPGRFDKLRRFIDGLPLGTITDAIYWRIGKKGLIKQTRAECEWWIGDLAVLWLERHGARFTIDENEDPLVYWPHGAPHDGKLFRVGSRRWDRIMRELGRITPRSIAGAETRAAIEAKCLDSRPLRIRPWSWSNITRAGGEIVGEVRLHLHDDDDRVAVARAGSVHLEPNARAELHATAVKLVQPIHWSPDVTAADGARLLYDRVACWLTCDPTDRTLVIAWAILSLARHSLNLRPILSFKGPAGVGKSGAAKLLSAFFHGEKRILTKPTPKSLYAAGDHPVTALDNVEEHNRQAVEDWLLIAATGGQRTIGTKEGGTRSQKVDTFALVTSIVVSGRYELLTRLLPVENSKEWISAGFSESAVVDAIAGDRSAMVSGILRLWADHVWPAWGELAALEDLVPEVHIAWRQRESLAALAIIGAALGQLDQRFTTLDAQGLLEEWLERMDARVGFAAVQTDPVLFGLQSVMRAWNRITWGPGEYWQQWVREEHGACTALFVDTNGKVATDVGANVRTRSRHGQTFPIVVGCVGTHHELHADIVRALRPSGLHDRFLGEIPDGSALAARWSQVAADGWHRQKLDRPRVNGAIGSWRYRFFATHLVEGEGKGGEDGQ